jgi:hypothetical protein
MNLARDLVGGLAVAEARLALAALRGHLLLIGPVVAVE